MELPERNLAGRPSKYEPSLGRKILAEMEQGYSLVAACSTINIGRTTVYRWLDEYPEFGELVELGKAARLQFLERRLINGEVTGPQATTAIFALKNASADWREDQKSSVTIDQTINHNHTVKLDTLSVDDLEQLAMIVGRGNGSAGVKVIEHEVDDE